MWIFIGPSIGSLADQFYLFLATKVLVRTESIITQLVFDHRFVRYNPPSYKNSSSSHSSLRIRMKAETDANGTSDSDSSTTSITPDSRSVVGSEDQTLHSTADSNEDTLTGSNDTASTASVSKPKPAKDTDKKEEGQSNANNLVSIMFLSFLVLSI